ncbi:MAG TPA: tetratricopeptide repeat protein, partial [Bacteroidetes bacterium]|nr:tetratricopeptide repeat protein [Bacteroidota bacterium]
NKPRLKASVSEPLSFGMVTETLAKILIKQGQPDKAIQIYKDLSLQNPEKSAYFDAQIKNLKDQL